VEQPNEEMSEELRVQLFSSLTLVVRENRAI
jgi:hypothetical protein